MVGKLAERVIISALVTQMVLGAVTPTWAQAPAGDRGSQGLRGAAGAKGTPPGKSGAARPSSAGGVQSAETAEEALPGGQALSQAVVRDKYVLGPGDRLSVNIWGDREESLELRVTPDGKVIIPSVGDIDVNGLTITEAEARITTTVKRYYRLVYVSVSLVALRVFQVLVLGEVQRPGTYLATPIRRVSELLEKAGGVLPSGSSRHIELRRAGRVQAYADLYRFLHEGDELHNPLVQDGDVIFVPKMGEARVVAYVSEIQTGVGGALTENSVPYVVEIKEGERLSAVIDQLGGVNPWWDLESLFIVRELKSPEGTMRIPVDLKGYLLKGEEHNNPVVLAGDQVYIPTLMRRVFIAGMVKVPGAYTYMPARTAESYIGLAGGALITADLSRSYIQRADGTVEPYVGSAELNNGDTIVVMEKLFKTYADYFAFFGTISSVILSAIGMAAVFGVGFNR